MSQPTPQAVSLYNALRERKIYCVKERWDGHKHVDISIPWAMIDVEIDGNHHYTDPEQIKRDFRRSWYSVQNKDYDTFHIPNIIIEHKLEQVADAIAIVARSHYKAIKEEENNKSIWKRMINLFK